MCIRDRSIGTPGSTDEIILLITPPQYTSVDDYTSKKKQIADQKGEKGKLKFYKEEINVGDEKGYKMKVTPVSPETFNYPTDILLFQNERIFILRQVYPETCQFAQCGIFNQMLSTFRFLE